VGITDEEYLWEPAPGGWSLRRRGEAISPMAYGAGDWVLDFALTEPKPAPVTTIAWRLGHLYTGFSLRWEWSFGARKKLWDTIQFTPSAEEAPAPPEGGRGSRAYGSTPSPGFAGYSPTARGRGGQSGSSERGPIVKTTRTSTISSMCWYRPSRWPSASASVSAM